MCDQCGKSYVIKSRLTEHLKVHLPENIDQPCKFCGKKIKEIKNLRAHERICDQNKTKSKAPRVQCPFFPKDFAQAKDMRRHAKDKHPTRDPRRASEKSASSQTSYAGLLAQGLRRFMTFSHRVTIYCAGSFMQGDQQTFVFKIYVLYVFKC